MTPQRPPENQQISYIINSFAVIPLLRYYKYVATPLWFFRSPTTPKKALKTVLPRPSAASPHAWCMKVVCGDEECLPRAIQGLLSRLIQCMFLGLCPLALGTARLCVRQRWQSRWQHLFAAAEGTCFGCVWCSNGVGIKRPSHVSLWRLFVCFPQLFWWWWWGWWWWWWRRALSKLLV